MISAKKSHRRTRVFGVDEYAVIDDERDDEGENKDLSQR